MTEIKRTKKIYKDLATGKLMPKKLAETRDPATWVEEEFVLAVDEIDTTEESFFEEGGEGTEEPPLLTQSV